MGHSSELNVVSWNILYDPLCKVLPPQNERILGIASTIANLSIRPDVIALYEVQGESNDNNLGRKVADIIGYTGCVWSSYGRRAGEGMAILTPEPQQTSVMDFESGIKPGSTMILELDKVAVVATHLPSRLRESVLRRRITTSIISTLISYEHAIIMGDLNAPPWQRSRRMITYGGYLNACSNLGKTFPSKTLPHQTIHPLHRPLVRLVSGFTIDAIYAKGMRSGVCHKFEGPSDHYGLTAGLKIVT